MDNNKIRTVNMTRQRSTTGGTPNAPSSPMMSPLNRHVRSASGGGVRKAQQTKAAAARLAAVMSHQPADDDDDEDDDELSYEYNVGSATGSIGLAGGGRLMLPRSPMTRTMAQTANQKVGQWMANQPANEDNDEDDLLSDYSSMSGRPSIGLAGGKSMRSCSPMTKSRVQTTTQKVAQSTPNQFTNEDKHDDDLSSDYSSVSVTKSIGRAGGKSMRSRSPMTKTADQTAPQRLMQSTGNQATYYDNEEDDDYSLMSGTANIGLAGGRATRSRSPMSVHTSQEQPPSARPTSSARSSVSVNSVEQPSSAPSTSAGRQMQPENSVEQPQSARSTVAGRSSQSTSSIEQPPSARSTSAGRPLLGIKTVPIVPASVPISLRPPSPAVQSEPIFDNRRDKRLSLDMGSVSSLKETGRRSSAIQDELDMLQEENDSLLEKLRIAEERCEEAEARARQFEKQVATLGEGVSLSDKLLRRKEAVLQQREAALKIAEQTHGGKPEEIAAIRMEAETARNEAVSALEQLHEADCEIKSLRNTAQRMLLTREEMEEVVLKRCWLARYWSLCVQYGIYAEIAKAKFEYWSSFAPLPVEVVLAAGQRAKEENSSENNNAEEKEKAFKDLHELSGEGNFESMLLVEKGLHELASLKVEDAVALAMAQKRHSSSLKSDDVKLPIEGQFEAFELSQEESEDVRFKQAWLTYIWKRAQNHGLEPDIADERLQFWINHSARSSTSHDAVDVERGLMELRKLNIESQLWQESRKGLEQDNHPKCQLENDF
ncbi:hypothetical protein CFOL_v3_07726 [Cephalotus follicularis]|uniref:Coiled-coil domain-containing protein SCD2 n=1 Tax=Cephalotus follicularis TaxID=3775 RepID=A0A1Q3B887_CEPFO|nr:hypothetical protein CFOL_v3_07726 [Cephalotus follicularis]